MDSSSSNTTIRVIEQEHRCLAAVIRGMQHLTREIAGGGKAPDLKVFRAMLLYISEYPEKIHHPKEDHYLFGPLRARTNEVDRTIAQLETQHGQGERLARELEHALARYELLGSGAFNAFRDLVEQYVDFYFEHMKLEEEIILPAAKKYLTEEDWTTANIAFAANKDPLSGVEYRSGFDKLFSLITAITPAPFGVGPALE
jgi:hemerythrin-like domain-containing protein